MRYTIRDGYLPVEDHIRLFSGAGWGNPSHEASEISLKNSWAVFSCTDENNHVIAMARLIGDGATAFYLKDVVVEPEYQGQGIGRALLAYVEGYIRMHMPKGCTALYELTAAKGKEGFYRRLGFTENPNENMGAGFTKKINT